MFRSEIGKRIIIKTGSVYLTPKSPLPRGEGTFRLRFPPRVLERGPGGEVKVFHFPLVILLALFFVLVHLYQSAITPFEGPDEPEHFAYIEKLRNTGKLPDPETDLDSPIGQEAAQPPLYYVTAALFSRQRSLDDGSGSPTPNPWWAFQGPHTSRDNRNHFMMGPHTTNMQDDNQRHLAAAIRWIRQLSPFYGLLAITGVYLAGLALWPHERAWALLAAMGMALNPQLLQVFSLVSNDAAVIAFGSLTLAGALHLRTHWQSRGLVILTGLVMGLAALSKVTGLALWPLPVAAILLGAGLSSRNRRPAIRSLILLLGVAMLIGGWWYVRGLIRYDDPFGFAPHEQKEWAWTATPTPDDLLDRLPILARGLWADFGWGSVKPGFWGYALPLVILLLSLIGWTLHFTSPLYPLSRAERGLFDSIFPPRRLERGPGGEVNTRKLQNDHIGLLLLTIFLAGIAIGRWMMVSNLVPGRLLFPFYGAAVLLVVWGLRALPRTRPWIAGALGGWTLIILAALVYPAFGPPALSDSPPDDLQGPVIDYGKMSFAGYQIDDPAIHTHDWTRIKLCWEAQPGQRDIPVPYAFALHIVGPENTILGGRESYPGLGTYTLWEPGKAFCDTFDLFISGDLTPGRVYPLALSLFDYETGGALNPAGSPDATTFIGTVRAPAPQTDPDRLERAPFRFEGVRLLDYDLALNERNLTLTLDWGAQSKPGRTLNLFVHIIDGSGTSAAQADPVLGGESYPSWAWDTGETISDTVVLPLDDLPAGEYQVQIGIYDPVTFVRQRATDAENNPLADDTVSLGTITLP